MSRKIKNIKPTFEIKFSLNCFEICRLTANLIPLSIFNESYSDLIEKGAQHVHLVIQTHILRNICFALKGNILCCNAVVFLSY